MSKHTKKSIAFFCGVVSITKSAKRRKRKQPVEVIDIPEVFPRVREVKPRGRLEYAKDRLFGNKVAGIRPYFNAVSEVTPGQLFKPLSLVECEMLRNQPARHMDRFRLRIHGFGGYLAGRFEPNGEIQLVHATFLIPDPHAAI